MTAAVPSTRRARGFEPWMISNVAVGMAVGSFLTLLVPPFITDVTGSAARVGIVFALVSLAATVGPWFGGRADRSGRHRRYYLIRSCSPTPTARLSAATTTTSCTGVSGVLILGRGSDGKITAGVGDLPGAACTSRRTKASSRCK